MITFEKFESHKGESYSCIIQLVPTGEFTLGYLHKEPDGFYYFFPNHIPSVFWPSRWLKEVGNRLSDLNEAETQRQLGEAYGHESFTD